MRLGVRTRLKRRIQRAAWNLRADHDRDELIARHLDGVRHFNRLLCESHADARLLELDGVVASALPALGKEPEVNVVLYEDPGLLAASLGRLADAYGEVGVEAWMVCVPPSDREAGRLLKRAGYRIQSAPLGMGRRLGSTERPPTTALEAWTNQGDPAVMAEIADRAFDLGTTFRRAYSCLENDRARVYLASCDGKPSACVMTTDFEGNCSIDMAATLPEARGRGLSGDLLGHALVDAAERGCETSTLLSSPMAQRLYERLGYAGLGPFEQWEHPARALS